MPRAKGQQRKNQLTHSYWRNRRRREGDLPRKRQRWDEKGHRWIGVTTMPTNIQLRLQHERNT